MVQSGDFVQIVKSNKGKAKICVNGFLFSETRHRNDLYYWHCEKKLTETGCHGTVGTLKIGDQHQLRYHEIEKHNHPPEASKLPVIKICNAIKDIAKRTNDTPAQIIQNTTAGCSQETRANLPSRDALRQKAKRARRGELPSEPTSLEDFELPDEYSKTISGHQFSSLIEHEEDRIIIFTTSENIRHLSEAQYWIMDGTFKTAPIIFKQLYTIHAPVGSSNRKILLLFYALMTAKSQELYKRMFEELHEMANQHNIYLEPEFVLTDFELASINAVTEEFVGVQNKGCFFHLGQTIYRKIRDHKLTSKYGTDENFSMKIRQIQALAFLSHLEIPAAWKELKRQIPNEAEAVVKWFEEYYVLGRIQRTLRNGNERRLTPTYPPLLWSVFENQEFGFPRTQNKVEAWHRRWETLVGRPHVGLFSIIVEIQKEQDTVEGEIERIICGHPSQKRRNEDDEREERLQNVVQDRANRTIPEFLRGIAHNLKF